MCAIWLPPLYCLPKSTASAKHGSGHKITPGVLTGKVEHLLASPHFSSVVFIGVHVYVAATRWPGVVDVSFKNFIGVRQF